MPLSVFAALPATALSKRTTARCLENDFLAISTVALLSPSLYFSATALSMLTVYSPSAFTSKAQAPSFAVVAVAFSSPPNVTVTSGIGVLSWVCRVPLTHPCSAFGTHLSTASAATAFGTPIMLASIASNKPAMPAHTMARPFRRRPRSARRCGCETMDAICTPSLFVAYNLGGEWRAQISLGFLLCYSATRPFTRRLQSVVFYARANEIMHMAVESRTMAALALSTMHLVGFDTRDELPCQPMHLRKPRGLFSRTCAAARPRAASSGTPPTEPFPLCHFLYAAESNLRARQTKC